LRETLDDIDKTAFLAGSILSEESKLDETEKMHLEDTMVEYQEFNERAKMQDLLQESFEDKWNMRGSNKFHLDRTMATLFGNRDKDLQNFVRRSITYRHQDLHLDKHTPHMKDVAKMLRPRESEKNQI
jgi:hypothetical protein